MNTERRKLILGLSILPVAIALGACQSASAPAAAPAKPASTAAAKLFIAADTVWGSKNLVEPQKTRNGCTLTSRFPRNAEMVWRVRVFDPESGALMDKSAMSKVEVKVSNGVALDMVYGLHPKETGEGFWTTSWVIPKDHPTGSFNYTITATDTKGRVGEWKPFSTAASLPVVLDEVLADAPGQA
jgi:hypothetical protein